MDRRIALVIVGVMLFVIIFLVGCVPTPPPTPPPTCPPPKVDGNTFIFSPSQGCVNRNVTIVALPQNNRAVEVKALPLPKEPPPTPPAEKKIGKRIIIVIEPEVTYRDTKSPLFDFDQPLTLTILYTADDCKATTQCNSGTKPPLSIVTVYPEGNVWHWAKLDTTVVCDNTCETGKLTVSLGTLHPKDPVEEGCC